MSEKNEDIQVNEAPESTIFSDPAHFSEQSDTKKRGNRRLLTRVLACVLAVGILAGATALAFKYIPELSTDKDKKDSISVTNTAENEVKALTVKNELGTVKLNTEITEENGESATVWSVDGVDKKLTSTAKISSFAKSALMLSALEKLSNDGTDFGFSAPKATVTVNADKEYTLYIGNTAPADLGYYCKTTLDSENIYIIDGAVAVPFITAIATDFADTTGFASVQNDKNASCFSGEEITNFDYIKISGKKHKTPIEIVVQEDDEVNAYFAFKMVKPTVRISDNDAPQAILDVFADGFAVDGAYAFSADSATLKKYGLDNPDYVVTLSLAGEAHTLKFSVVDDSYAAFFDGKTNMVQKIALSSISFATAQVENYYSSFIILENISGLSQMKVETPKGNFVFDIKYTEGAEEEFEISINGKKLDVARFKDYYGTLIEMTPISFETANIKKADVKVTYVHSGSLNDTVLAFKKSSELRYQAEIDGNPTGQITSTAVEKFISDTVKMANGTY